MKSKELLFELIHSLTKSEKRFVKINAQVHKGDKLYLKLMDAIDKQKEYDETKLLEIFKEEEFTNQFSVAKNYLQNFILKQLRQYHSGLKTNIECKNLLIDIEILFWKGQYNLAEKLISKTEKIAKKYELFLALEELNNWKSRIYNVFLKLDINYKMASDDKVKKNIENYKNILEYKELTTVAHLLIKQSEVIRDDEEKNNYEKLLKNPLLINLSNAKSNQAKYSYYVLNSVIYRATGKVKESKEFRKKLVSFLESQPHLIEENPIQYIAAVHNLLMNCLIEHDYPFFHENIAKLKNYNFKMPHEKAHLFSTLSLFELGYFTEKKEYDNAIKFAEDALLKYGNISNLLNIEHEFLFHYHVGLAYYHKQEYSKALKRINNVINITPKNLRVDIKASTYILNILTHYELKNYEILPYLINSAISFLKISKMYRKIDQLFLSIFKHTPSTSNQKETIIFLEIKLNEMNKLKDKTTIVSDIDYFNWINSKINTNKILLKKNN